MTSSPPTSHNGPSLRPSRQRLPRFKGVRRRSWGTWVAEIRVPHSRQRLWLGSYQSPHQAARAYDIAALCLRGPAAVLNLPSLAPTHTPARASCLSPTSVRNFAAREAAQFCYPLPEHNPDSAAAAAPPSPLPRNSLFPLHSPPTSDANLDHGNLRGPAAGDIGYPHAQTDLQHLRSSPDAAQLEQTPPGSDSSSPSFVDLWFGLDFSPAVDPSLKQLLTHSLYPASGTRTTNQRRPIDFLNQ